MKVLEDTIAIPVQSWCTLLTSPNLQVGQTETLLQRRHLVGGDHPACCWQGGERDTMWVWLASGLDLSRTRRRFVTTCSDLSDNKLRFVIAFNTYLSLVTGFVLVYHCNLSAANTFLFLSECEIFFSKLSPSIALVERRAIHRISKCVFISLAPKNAGFLPSVKIDLVVRWTIRHPRNMSNSIQPTSIQTCQRKS